MEAIVQSVAERCAEPRRSIGRGRNLKKNFDCDGRIEVPTVGINQSIVNKWVFYYPPAQALRYDPFICFIK
jgi:hypothetical protein